jgi:hypothetical protein
MSEVECTDGIQSQTAVKFQSVPLATVSGDWFFWGFHLVCLFCVSASRFFFLQFGFELLVCFARHLDCSRWAQSSKSCKCCRDACEWFNLVQQLYRKHFSCVVLYVGEMLVVVGPVGDALMNVRMRHSLLCFRVVVDVLSPALTLCDRSDHSGGWLIDCK